MWYAKSNPQESILAHTNRLLQELETLRLGYGDRIDRDDSFWTLLRLAAHLHDFGKGNPLFQNKIRKQLGEPELPCLLSREDELPHNYISVALIPYSQMQLDDTAWKLLVFAVGYHHERQLHPERIQIQQFMEQSMTYDDIRNLYAHMQWPYEPEKPSNRLLNWLQKRKEILDSLQYDPVCFRRYVLLKGLLHRLDHAASAHVDVETGTDEDVGSKVRAFVEGRYELRPAQQFAAESGDSHAIMVASTGSGKTEAALLWAGQDKTFITLPLRVSLNAMYDRLRNIGNVGLQSLGLLHSGSFDYLFEMNALDAEVSYRISRQLAHKVTLTTIDQILKFPFLYRGFEKELATMAYSKLVIDEIQAYDPNIAAMLVKALEMMAAMGGKFMVMTATMPKIYLNELQRRMANLKVPLAYGEFPNDQLVRHRIHLRHESVIETADSIIQDGEHFKVLVICNTVDRAIQVYEQVKKKVEAAGLALPVHLLHARFIRKHKQALEQLITRFAQSGWHETPGAETSGIWIATQIVEASLDVDFDVLYTELCTLDSLFQRMGRCYRVRTYDHDEPNIHILTREASGIGSVYDKQIASFSLDALRHYQHEMLAESVKMKLVNELYSREKLEGTLFLKEFDDALRLFDNMPLFDLTADKAQTMLRDISSTEIIPPPYEQAARRIAADFSKEGDAEKRRMLRRELEQLAVPLNNKTLHHRNVVTFQLEHRGLEYLHWINRSDITYDFDEETMQGAGLKYRQSSDIV